MDWALLVVVPIGMLFLGVLGKRLASPSGELEWSDAYLGLEFALAIVAVCMINFGELNKMWAHAESAKDKSIEKMNELEVQISNGADPKSLVMIEKRTSLMESNRAQDELLKGYRKEYGWTTLCLCFGIFSFLFIGLLHRQWEPKTDDALSVSEIRKKRLLLAVVPDLVGLFGMLFFQVGVKGVH